MENQRKRLEYLKKIGIKFKKVLDIGAYEGEWTKMFKSFYPEDIRRDVFVKVPEIDISALNK